MIQRNSLRAEDSRVGVELVVVVVVGHGAVSNGVACGQVAGFSSRGMGSFSQRPLSASQATTYLSTPRPTWDPLGFRHRAGAGSFALKLGQVGLIMAERGGGVLALLYRDSPFSLLFLFQACLRFSFIICFCFLFFNSSDSTTHTFHLVIGVASNFSWLYFSSYYFGKCYETL